MTSFAVRRVHGDEWRCVRDLRIEAVSDPDAGIAFLSTVQEERARHDEFWRERAAAGAASDHAAQFVAVAADVDARWVGTVTVLLRPVGCVDHAGRLVATPRADVVGVYVAPVRRGAGVIDALLDTAAGWAAERGFFRLDLDVHADNERAQAAYRRCGFVRTGEEFTGPIGPEIGMVRQITTR